MGGAGQSEWQWPKGQPHWTGPTGGPQVPFDEQTGLPLGWDEQADENGIFSQLFEMARVVYHDGACALPGSTIKYEPFVQICRYAVHTGYVQEAVAERVLSWLRWGTDAGVQRSQLHGVRVFENYESALGEWRDKVTMALSERVHLGKTLDLGPSPSVSAFREVACRVFLDSFVAPMLAVPKALEPDKVRPATDHGITTLNDATDEEGLKHELQAHRQISWLLRSGYVMHVSDVQNAFPILPLTPWIWPFFFIRFFRQPRDQAIMDSMHLLAHIFADFGTRGLPGAFKLFFVDCVCGMARSLGVLTLPLVVHVDDTGLIGASVRRVLPEMRRFQMWATALGVSFKELKDKVAAQIVLMIGFWWNSIDRTICLDDGKRLPYMEMFKAFSVRAALCLRER